MISAVVLAKNEEKNIGDCLSSLSWCDEIVVIDDFSQDNTIRIAKADGAKVFQRSLDDDFAGQRNFGLEKTAGDWVLFVDADERVSPGLAKEIMTEVQVGFHFGSGTDLPVRQAGTPPRGFYLKRTDVVWGKELKHGENGNIKLLRLARRGSGQWERAVHETWNIRGKTEELKSPLLHFPHPTLREFVSDIDKYSTLHALENLKEGKHSSLFKIIFYPPAKFFSNWILRLGFLDGTVGLNMAMILSLHSFLAWGKLWLFEKRRTQRL
ncbi:MAG: glycosyltransferase family 2 protein [Candidatus Blackburnbacteria bacterium]|nr:glycosyltransferase family 2 protein [Candidatus Blackburnbacteria bacterium]